VFILFVCGAALHKIRSVAAQLHKQHLLLLCVARKEEEEEGNGIAFFFFFFVLWSCYSVAAPLHGVELPTAPLHGVELAAAPLHSVERL
jgi:hypothetical protein